MALRCQFLGSLHVIADKVKVSISVALGSESGRVIVMLGADAFHAELLYSWIYSSIYTSNVKLASIVIEFIHLSAIQKKARALSISFIHLILIDFLPAENFIFYICRMEWKRKIYKVALLLVKQMEVLSRRALLVDSTSSWSTSLNSQVRTENELFVGQPKSSCCFRPNLPLYSFQDWCCSLLATGILLCMIFVKVCA